ncbi:TRAP transporter small permease [Acidimangrovimonas sediminis]|uniref:TRAP transporter small permease n=1 Tax=Acidimangrovimonas sediminis TaxID=2056283 RepID=UPI000C800DAE|nr:TRAP transporter small permease [Acidimangrovimonas sediminis]
MIQTARRALEVIAAALVVGLILVTCVDVVGRYLFNAPLRGAYDLTQILLGALVFAALPLVTARGGHVEVDLFLSLMPARAARVLGVAAAVVTALVLVYFAFRLGFKVEDDVTTGRATQGIGFPLWTLGAVGLVSCVASAIVALARKPE